VHKLLERQLQRCYGSIESAPAELQAFLALVDAAYHEADADRQLLEHSMQTVSQESIERYRKLHDEENRNRVLSEAQLITVERRAEVALRDSERRFTAIYEHAAAGIVLTDSDGRIVQANPAIQALIGYSGEELVGRPSASLSPPEEAPITRKALQELREGAPSVIVEKWFRKKSGELFLGKLTLSLVRSEIGEMIYTVGIIEDITESRRIGEALVQSEERLRQAQKMEAVGQLAAGVAHDFNNLLTVIGGHASMLLEELREDDPMYCDVSEIRHAATRAAGLTRQLLAFSRRQVLQPKLVQVNAVIEGLVPMLRRLIGEDIAIECRLAAPLPAVNADPGQLEQVIMNLAVNARDAMPGGGTLLLETREVIQTHGDSGLPADFVEITVQDTGTGMSREVLQHLFEPFFTTKEPGKGTGLGLATVYGIITQSGGQVNVSSTAGAGSTFRIRLPATAGTAPEDRLDPLVSSKPATGTILVVEDDPAVRNLASRVLERAGYRVIPAASASEALELARAQPDGFDLLLTDMVMPEMNGRQLAGILTAANPALPVLFMSGYTDDDILRRGLTAHGAKFLQKPFTPVALIDAISELLSESASK
jgi:PAS domain S-box-containing protein